MDILNIPVPAVYREESADFRFFQKWFALALSKVQYDTEEFFDLFDPLRCPQELLWMLADTMGYVYDDRMTPAFNRLVMVYFMSMIRLKGSKDGVTLAAQLNLDQFKLQDLAAKNSILNNRLEDTSIPSNAIYVQPHVEEGYIDLVYFSDELPTDVCLDYARPLGMYLAPRAGVRYDAKGQISVDARLTNTSDLNVSIGSTHVGHYSVDDYSRMQRMSIKSGQPSPEGDPRQKAWYRNSAYEREPTINPGYRALSSLQLANGSTTTRSILRSVPDIDKLTADDVSVFNEDTHETFNNEYYEAQEHGDLDNLEYVAPVMMGQLGDSMQIVPGESSENLENSEDDSEDIKDS